MKSEYIKMFKKDFLKYFSVILLIVLIIIFSFFLIKGIWTIRRQWIMNQHKITQQFFSNHKTSISDVNYIENWMTFHYINHIFSVPENYFKDKLNIDDKKYPNIPLWRYAKSKNIDLTVFLNQVKSFLSQYIKQNPIK